MKFAFAQIIGIIGDQLTWWGEALQEVSARITRKVTGIEDGDSDEVRVRKLLDYVHEDSKGL